MKFGKYFRSVIEEAQPDLRDKFLRYKELKKLLKNLQPRTPAGRVEGEVQPSKEESEFVEAVAEDLKKLNDFFMEKEEELVMKENWLSKRANEASASQDANTMALMYAKFHGEVVMVENWCLLNYAALVKILKKHDKQSGISLRHPILRNVLHQPFYSTDVLTGLIRRAEEGFKRMSEKLREREGSETVSEHHGKARANGTPAAPPMQGLEGSGLVGDAEGQDSLIARVQSAISMWKSLESAESLKQPLGSPPASQGGPPSA